MWYRKMIICYRKRIANATKNNRTCDTFAILKVVKIVTATRFRAT